MDVSVQLIFVTISVVAMDINFLPWLLECRDNCTLWPSCLHGSSGREKLGLASLRLCTIPESAQKTLHHFTQAFQFIVAPPKRRGSGDIWPIPQGSLLSRENFFSSTNHIAENTICSATPEILSYFTMTHFLAYQFSTIHTASYEFIVKPEESAECHQTLSLWVGSGHKTRLLAYTRRRFSVTL